MGRVLSPNDVYYNYDPWRSVRTVDVQNPIVNDPPAAYLTLASLLKDDPQSFHWNRYIGSGVPGYGALAAAVLSPFVFVPVLLLPLLLFYTGMVVLKIIVGFLGAYLWLREERLGRAGAAIGALAFTAAGPYAVWWLWQGTNATALYGVGLWMLARAAHRKRNSVVLVALLCLAFLFSGFPATIVYFAYVAAAYLLVGVVRRAFSLRSLSELLAGFVIAALLAAPLVWSFSQYLRRTGHLDTRRTAASTVAVYPAEHLMAFINPFRLGDPAGRIFLSRDTFSPDDNFVESTVYVGVVTLALLLLGLLSRRRRPGHWLWAALALLLMVVMFSTTPLNAVVARLPGIGYSAITRLRTILPIPVAFFVAAGVGALCRLSSTVRWKRGVALVGIALAIDLSLFAARFFPYLPPDVASIPVTSTQKVLRSEPQPFRVAPMFDAYWPNTAELVRIEDIRSHFASEGRYRRMFLRIDPHSWGEAGTVLLLNSLQSNLDDPLISFLNTRFVYEQPSIDILRWKSYEKITRNAPVEGELLIGPGSSLVVDVEIADDEIHAIELMAGPRTPDARLRARLIVPETGKVVEAVDRSADELRRLEKVYLPLRKRFHAGNHLLLEIEADGLVSMPAAEGSRGSRPAYGFVRSALVQLGEYEDGRLFENLTALPRYFAVWQVEQTTFDDFLAHPRDLAATSFVETAPAPDVMALAKVPREKRRVRFIPRIYGASRQIIDVEAEVPFFFVSSEKVSPELRFYVDGQRRAPIVTNGLFIGTRIGPGRHTIEVRRRLGGGLWPLSVLGALTLAAGAVYDRRRRAWPPE